MIGFGGQDADLHPGKVASADPPPFAAGQGKDGRDEEHEPGQNDEHREAHGELQ